MHFDKVACVCLCVRMHSHMHAYIYCTNKVKTVKQDLMKATHKALNTNNKGGRDYWQRESNGRIQGKDNKKQSSDNPVNPSNCNDEKDKFMKLSQYVLILWFGILNLLLFHHLLPCINVAKSTTQLIINLWYGFISKFNMTVTQPPNPWQTTSKLDK